MNPVQLEKRQGFAIVTLNRPDAMNALSREPCDDFVTALAECRSDESIRVLIITGNGRAFCAGFDLKELAQSDASAELKFLEFLGSE